LVHGAALAAPGSLFATAVSNVLRLRDVRPKAGGPEVRRKISSFLVALAVLASTVGGLAAGPISAAHAYGYYTLVNWEYIDGWGRFDQPRKVWNMHGFPGIVGHVACVGALDYATNTWAGTSVCAFGDVDHDYNGYMLRQGWGGVPYGHVAEINTTTVAYN
jgi:hypothetical protein